MLSILRLFNDVDDDAFNVQHNTLSYASPHSLLERRSSAMSQILALNCGSSSVKAKVYSIGEGEGQGIQPELFASIAISNINAQAEKIGVKLKWADGRGKDINEEQDSGDAVKRESTHSCERGRALAAQWAYR